jgi:hypothetical protein
MANNKDAKGRLKKNPDKFFVQVPNQWFQHPSKAWLSLPQGAKSLWIIIRSYYNGINNGNIFLSVRHATKLLGCAKGSTESWFKELEAKGFIKRTKQGYLGLEGKGVAATWEMTHLGRGGERPTKDFLKWPENKTPS